MGNKKKYPTKAKAKAARPSSSYPVYKVKGGWSIGKKRKKKRRRKR